MVDEEIANFSFVIILQQNWPPKVKISFVRSLGRNCLKIHKPRLSNKGKKIEKGSLDQNSSDSGVITQVESILCSKPS